MYKTRCGLRLVRTMWYTAPVVPWHLVACTALLTARYMLPHDASPPDTSLTFVVYLRTHLSDDVCEWPSDALNCGGIEPFARASRHWVRHVS